MNKTFCALVIYALLLFVGGAIGYVTKNSIPSIAMGSASAFLIALTTWGMLRGKACAHKAALLLTSLLTAFFIYRYFATWTFIPAGLMSLYGLGVIFLLWSPCSCKKR